MTDARQIDQEIEARINSHLKNGLDKKFTEDVQWHIKMANQWIETLANLRNLPESDNGK